MRRSAWARSKRRPYNRAEKAPEPASESGRYTGQVQRQDAAFGLGALKAAGLRGLRPALQGKRLKTEPLSPPEESGSLALACGCGSIFAGLVEFLQRFGI